MQERRIGVLISIEETIKLELFNNFSYTARQSPRKSAAQQSISNSSDVQNTALGDNPTSNHAPPPTTTHSNHVHSNHVFCHCLACICVISAHGRNLDSNLNSGKVHVSHPPPSPTRCLLFLTLPPTGVDALVGAHVPGHAGGVGGYPGGVHARFPSAVSSVSSFVAKIDESSGSCESEPDEDVLNVGTTTTHGLEANPLCVKKKERSRASRSTQHGADKRSARQGSGYQNDAHSSQPLFQSYGCSAGARPRPALSW